MFRSNGQSLSTRNSDKCRTRHHRLQQEEEIAVSLKETVQSCYTNLQPGMTRVQPCAVIEPGEGRPPGRRQQAAFQRTQRKHKEHQAELRHRERLSRTDPPEGVEAAWIGCISHPRVTGIRDQMIGNLVGSSPGMCRLERWILGRGISVKPLWAAGRAAESCDLLATETRDVVLYEDGLGVVGANPHSSCAYIYLTAYLLK